MTRTTSKTNEKALDAFIAAKAEIDQLLANLEAFSADHFHARDRARPGIALLAIGDRTTSIDLTTAAEPAAEASA